MGFLYKNLNHVTKGGTSYWFMYVCMLKAYTWKHIMIHHNLFLIGNITLSCVQLKVCVETKILFKRKFHAPIMSTPWSAVSFENSTIPIGPWHNAPYSNNTHNLHNCIRYKHHSWLRFYRHHSNHKPTMKGELEIHYSRAECHCWQLLSNHIDVNRHWPYGTAWNCEFDRSILGQTLQCHCMACQ